MRCFRPADRCYCRLVPRVNNRTDVLILQHRREREHPFNTARIVNMALARCRLIADHNAALASFLSTATLSPDASLLYPGDDVPLLTELRPEDRPKQLVVLDGTWHHTKTLMRDIPQLAKLRRFRLAPQTPGRYRIRREPDDLSLSTLEAVVAALAENEPDNPELIDELTRLTAAFDGMIDQQLACPKSNWRQNAKRIPGAPNIPRVLLTAPMNIVVAYGEQEQGDYRPHTTTPTQSKGDPAPVYWIAKRLISDEVFETAIDHECLRDEYFASKLQLTAKQVDTAITLDQFRERWQDFLKPHDVVVVHHPGTEKMIRSHGLDEQTCVVLKSINAPTKSKVSADSPINESRAAVRLSNAIALTKSFIG